MMVGTGLDTQVLNDLFQWLLQGKGTVITDIDLALVLRFWAWEVARARECARDEDGEMHLSGQFGYHLVEKLATLVLLVPEARAERVWLPLLELVPAGHIAIEHFIKNIFLELSKGASPSRFEALLHALANYAVAANWSPPGLWFHGERILRLILGFGNKWALINLPDGAAVRMHGLLERWTKDHLKQEDNLAGLCRFLATVFGAPLRLDGLSWIQDALRTSNTQLNLHRGTSGDSLVDLIATVLQHDLTTLRTHTTARDALLDIAAALASTGHQGALVLQDRLRTLV
ncbi:hypothetical protein [Xanthomonas hawaiiensis]|uniref:hypothetical protein n=1 Tax=Xanthomonas hawaiiensis TaxID=3003247 RepID=UPI0028806480|nr:hypothetical protein [Xanthomonas sp. A6251]WNH43974.1 hypothetical protein PG878_15825 [Xanthomonas sp. A6251]